MFYILHSTAQRFISRDGTHKIEVSDIIIFMYSIQQSMHKTDTHNLFFKKKWPEHFLSWAGSWNHGILVGSDGGLIVGGHF